MSLRDRFGLVNALAEREDGQTMAEYAFILALVALVSIAAFAAFGEAVVRLFEPIAKAVAP